MKTAARTFKTLLIAWLCLFSLANLKAIPGLVLCFGEDGHVELELAVKDRCGSGEPSPDNTLILVPEADDHCGDCSDIPLLSESIKSHFHQPDIVAPMGFLPVGAVPPEQALPYAVQLPAGTRVSPPPLPSPALISIRSVRLLV